jgi:hypothetical protein
MLRNISRGQVVGAWVAAVIVLIACSVVAGAVITVGLAELWVIACLVPPGIVLLLWHGDRPLSAAQLIDAVDRPSRGGRS